MYLYRIAKAAYAADMRGLGGLYEAGRWHREGTQIVYTSSLVALAMLEVLVHWRKTPVGLMLVTIEIPENASILPIDVHMLPDNWRDVPYLPALADIADQWIREQKFWVMRVPSVHSPSEFNYLLNPLHPAHQMLKIVSIEPHPFDLRLKS